MKKLFYTAAVIGALAVTTTAAMAERGGDDRPPMDGRGMMERIDTDGDGVISKAEFMAKHEEMFAKMDANGDGKLTKDEMEAAKEKMREKRQEMREKRKGDAAPAPATEQ